MQVFNIESVDQPVFFQYEESHWLTAFTQRALDLGTHERANFLNKQMGKFN